MRSFVGIDLGVEGATDETTVCKFRHLLERNKLGKTLLTAVNDHLHRSGIKITKGTIVDATIIGAPGSTNSAYGAKRLEAACTHTLTHPSPFDRTVKSILGHCAIRRGVDVLFTSCTQLAASLNAARANRAYERKFAALARVSLLIIHDFGLRPLRPPADEDLHDSIAERYERVSTIVTTTKPKLANLRKSADS